MPSLTKLLAIDKNNVLTGEIIQRQTDKMYRVKIGNRILSVQSLASGEALPRHSQVVVIKTDAGFYITNKKQIKDRQKIEVTIDG
jgi:hypothetical protein